MKFFRQSIAMNILVCSRPMLATGFVIPRLHGGTKKLVVHSARQRTARLFSRASQRSRDGIETPKVEVSPSDHNTTSLQNFQDGALDSRIAKTLKKQGFVSPTPIQSHGIPLLQEGHDVMASSKTGSGKTLMFSLPLLDRLLQETEQVVTTSKGPRAIILNPTRELAQQTATAIRDLLAQTPGLSNEKSAIRVALATGGASVQKQRSQSQQADIIVATPGRLLQFIDERTVSLKSVQDLIIDESDTMVDLGFEEQLRRIAQALKRQQSRAASDRRTVLCSATFPLEVQRIAADFLKSDYYFIAVGRVGATSNKIQQEMFWVEDSSPRERRQSALREIKKFLQSAKKTPEESKQSQVIVFCNTKDEAESIGTLIQKELPIKSRIVTGDKSQEERNRSLDAFRKGKVEILIVTDVASRGLDVPTIGLVVQVDVPRDSDTFVHRVGRTGRAGSSGKAISFVDGKALGVAPALVQLLDEAQQEVPAWLLGMSHVKNARTLEEEGAIAAGGGIVQSDQEELDVDVDSDFSKQDFRSNAAAGSWGSERDKSYRDFDSHAYSDFGGESVSTLEVDTFSSVDTESLEADCALEVAVSQDEAIDSRDESLNQDNHAPKQAFYRPKPSNDLIRAVREISGTDSIGEDVDRKILNELSERSYNRRLRFEYLGMFPFDSVRGELVNNDNNGMRGKSNPNGKDMPTLLMVAEKPSIAKAIADALSGPRGPRQRRGISRAIPVYELVTNRNIPSQFQNKNKKSGTCRVLVSSVLGHVFSLGFDQAAQEERPDPRSFFDMPVVKQSEGTTDKLRIIDHLRALAGECDHLVLWLDCDAEGENIAYEVMAVTRNAMEMKVLESSTFPSNRGLDRCIHRAQFSAITKEAIQDAFQNLGEPDPDLSRSVDARQELDLRVGVALTRLVTWRCVGMARQRFSPATKVVSYGPCQTPALSFCVDRAREIESFKGEEFWRVSVAASFSRGKQSKPVALTWIPPEDSLVFSNRKGSGRNNASEPNSSYDENAAQDATSSASRTDAVATVVGIEEKSEKINAPLGLNTVALLSAGSKAMGISPKKLMQTAEKLYSAGYISYPRTETTKYDPKGMDVRSTLNQFVSHPQFGPTASYLLRSKYSKSGRPPQKGRDEGDHPPITCLKSATRNDLHGIEWRVYEFVVRTTLGSFSNDLLYTRQVVDFELSPGNHKFQKEQIQVDSLGFAGACPWVLKDIGAEPKDSNGKRPNSIDFHVGMKLPIANARMDSCKTRPPSFLQEHELIELMEKNCIGTDASMAVHVTNIQERGYVALCDETGVPIRPPRPPRPGQKPLPRQIGRCLVPTSLGIGLIDLFGSNQGGHEDSENSLALLARPAIRAQMESEVKQIALRKQDKDECVERNLDFFSNRYDELNQALTKRRLQQFRASLRPIKDSLRYWRGLGAFEAPKENQNTSSPNRTHGRKRPANSKRSSGNTNHGRGKTPGKRKSNAARNGSSSQQKTRR